MHKKLRLLILGIYTVSLFNFSTVPAVTFASVETCDLIPNSHQEGDQCVCNAGYTAKNISCVPFTCDDVANSHQVGSQCICDTGYTAQSGSCVPFGCDDIANSHLEGSQCICDTGYTAQSGSCVPFGCDNIANSHLVGSQCICDTGYTAKSGSCVPFTCDHISNSHLEGSQCICDDNFKAENGQCVAVTCDKFPNSHPEGRDCICDDFFRASGGQCVPMSDEEVCPNANTHREGDKCVCNEGYGSVNGVCTSKTLLCSQNHATYDASIDDCKCNTGYAMNEAGNGCDPVSKSGGATPPPIPNPTSLVPTPDPSIPNPTSLVPEPGSQPLNTSLVPTPGSEPSTTTPPPQDPLQLLLQLKTDPNTQINMEDALKTALQNATKEEAALAQKQQEAYDNMVKSSDGEMELPPSAEQKLNVIKGATIQVALDDEKEWQNEVNKAEAEGRVKNEADKKTFDDLKNQEQALLTQYKQNQDALNNLNKQTFQIMTLTQIPTVPNTEMIFKPDPNVPQRNFIKENDGDLKGAMASVAEATAGQLKLLNDYKEQMRKVKEQKRALLNVPPKPDTEAKLNKEGEKMGWEKNWYK